MNLSSGHRLGPYEIVAPLGAGGMGEVYRAKDTRLGRDVAVKVLPAHLSASPEVRARFEREAKTVSNLNHPNICVLHDVGREGETDYLVMELIEGETLAERLTKGPLPTPEVLRVGAQIADALDRAHREGVIHRDLKPGNIMLIKSGAKLMDFGLARSTGLGGPAGASGATMAALSQSPTVAQPLTAEGSIIGTFQYMSPEQLEGKETDARSDIWAFGCVLYEMATGRKAFEGQSQASLISAIMSQEPTTLSQISPASPAALDPIVRACLAKDPEERLQTAHDLKLQLSWIQDGGSQSGVAAAPAPAPVATRARPSSALPWAIAALAAVIAVLALTVLRPAPRDEVPIWATVGAPPSMRLSIYSCNVVMSPTGRSIAIVGVDSTGQFSLWVRPVDSQESTALFRTGDAWWPFWSPDGEHIAFFDRIDRKLKRVAIAGGSPTVICDSYEGRGGAWNQDGVIIFAAAAEDQLVRVAASGGAATPATTLDSTRGETGHRFPAFLPDGEHYLFAVIPEGPEGFEIHAASLDKGVVKRLMVADSAPVYVEPGYLVFERNGSVLVQRFDAGKLELKGNPMAIADAPAQSDLDADPVASASRNGLMTILRSEPRNTYLEMVDRSGDPLRRYVLPQAPWSVSSMSRDGRSAVVANGIELWVVDLERSVPMQFAQGTPGASGSAWSPDGQRIAYVTRVDGRERIDIATLDGRSQPLVDDDSFKRVFDWTRDGRYVIYAKLGSTTGWDMYAIAVDGAGEPLPLTQGPTWEFGGAVSPDGRWLAYQSNESGRYEIYVQSFPEPGRKVRVTVDGGANATWAKDGRELLYTRGPAVMSVPVESTEDFRPGQPRQLRVQSQQSTGAAVDGNGDRFLVSLPEQDDAPRDIRMVVNWTALIEGR